VLRRLFPHHLHEALRQVQDAERFVRVQVWNEQHVFFLAGQDAVLEPYFKPLDDMMKGAEVEEAADQSFDVCRKHFLGRSCQFRLFKCSFNPAASHRGSDHSGDSLFFAHFCDLQWCVRTARSRLETAVMVKQEPDYVRVVFGDCEHERCVTVA